MALWYFEQMMPTGAWSPRTSPTRPSEVTPSGAKIKIRNVNDVSDEYIGCPIEFLRDLFNPNRAQEVATEEEAQYEAIPLVRTINTIRATGPELIDRFAMAALPVAREHIIGAAGYPSPILLAQVAYDIAVAMSEERKKHIR